MNPNEWFVLGIRLFGLWRLIEAVISLASFVDMRILKLNEPPRGTHPTGYLFYAAVDFALAAWLLLGSRRIARACESEGNKSAPNQGVDEMD